MVIIKKITCMGFYFVLFSVFSGILSCNKTQNGNNDNTNQQKSASYKGLIMAGYQGWFNCEGDGAERGWNHYRKGSLFEPGNCTIDFWPEMSEYPRQYETPFSFADGTAATLFSSYDESTVDLHFQWKEDWKKLVMQYDLLDTGRVSQYLCHNEKPLVAVWGAGFNDGRKYSLEDVDSIVDFLKNDPEYGGFSVLLGVPTYWRTLDHDTQPNELLHPIIRKGDIVHTWLVGRFNEETYPMFKNIIQQDIAWCKENGVDYVPTVFPGFSWHNMKPEYPSDQIPRNKGNFFWTQIGGAISVGAEMIYVAMFDEIDEGTEIL